MGEQSKYSPLPCQNDEMAKNEDTVKLVIGRERKRRYKLLCAYIERDMSSVASELIDAWCEQMEKELAEQSQHRKPPAG